MFNSETRVPIESEMDIVTARQKGRSMALELGFDNGQATAIAAAISEVSRNIVEYAKSGEIMITVENRSRKCGFHAMVGFHFSRPGSNRE